MKYIKLFEAIGNHLVNDYFIDELWKHISLDEYNSILDDYRESNRVEEIGNNESEKLRQVVNLFLSKYKFKTDIIEAQVLGRYEGDEIKYEYFLRIEGFKGDQLWMTFDKLADSYWLVTIDCVIFEIGTQMPLDSLVMEYFLCDDFEGLEKWATEYLLPTYTLQKDNMIKESISNLNELFEIFKEVAEDVVFMEFESDPTSMTFGPLSIDKSSSNIYILPGIIPKIENWGFCFQMTDDPKRKKFVLERICTIFKIKTGIEIYYKEKGRSYNSKLKVIFSKKEWIDTLNNIQDFEQSIDFSEIISDRYKQSVKVIDRYKLHGSLKDDISYIFMISDFIGLRLVLKRFEFSDKMEDLYIKDGVLEYILIWSPVFLIDAGKSYDEPKFIYLDSKNKSGRNVEQSERVINASNELIKFKSERTFKIDIVNEDGNIDKFKKLINGKVLPLLEDKASICYGKFYDQIEKLNKQDNIFIETEISDTYKVIDIYSVFLCETTIGDRDFVFKMMLDVTRSMVNIYNNGDNNSDGPLLSRVDVDELSDTLFLLFTDNKFTPIK